MQTFFFPIDTQETIKMMISGPEEIGVLILYLWILFEFSNVCVLLSFIVR